MRVRVFFHLLLALVVLFVIAGCSPSVELIATETIDPAGGLTREDYLALRDRGGPVDEATKKKEPSSASKLPTVERETADRLKKPVSVTVTESVPVRDVLMELVGKAGLNMQIDPRVQGGVIISAKDQPFGDVLKRICEMANLRYTIDGSFIHIEPDEPYQKSYRLDYLSLHRRTTSDTSIATNVFDVDVTTNSATGGSSTTSASAKGNNSTAKVSAVSEADFWSEAEKSLSQILTSGETRKGSTKPAHSVDRQAGIVTVYGTQKQHNAVEKYFAVLRRKASAQVLIDARIIEVELDDAYKSGIDWTGIVHNLGARAAGAAASFGTLPAFGTNGFFTLGVDGNNNFGGMLNLVQTFGTTRVLSAPRLTVLNNQTAVMKVATNQVYFVTQAQFTTSTNATGALITTNPVYTSTPHTVPVGLVMTVQPSIDTESNRITMTLRPTISRVVGQVDDPSIGLNAAMANVSDPVHSKIPVLAVREMDSVIQLHSGEIAVLGGLMQDSSVNQDQGIPGLADIYAIGNLFKSRDNEGKVSELVILLRATISDQPAPDSADSMLYDTYNQDPRPVKMPKPSLKPVPEDTEDDPTS